MGDELDKNLSLKAMVVLRKALRRIDTDVYTDFKDFGLTPTQFSVLDVLYAKGEMKICDLIASILATSGNMTVVIKNMERNGWIYRKGCPNDKRASLVGLTPEGEALIGQVLPKHTAQVEKVFAAFSDQEKEELISLLKKFKSS